MRKGLNILLGFFAGVSINVWTHTVVFAQSTSDLSEQASSINRAIAMRLDWLRDTIPIDGCSIVKVTADPTFLRRLDSRLLRYVDTSQVNNCQRPARHVGPYVEILELRTVTKDNVPYVAVRQMVRKMRGGSSVQTFYLHPTLSFINIEAPVYSGDIGTGPPRDSLSRM